MDKRRLTDYLKHFNLGMEEEVPQIWDHEQVRCCDFIKKVRERFGEHTLPPLEVINEDVSTRALELARE